MADVVYLKTLKAITDEMYGRGEYDRNRYYHNIAAIAGYKQDIEDVVYKGCPLDLCMKKVQPARRRTWYCEKCNDRFPTFQYRYKLKVFLCDGSRRPFLVTMFDDTAEPFFGISAPGLVAVHDDDQDRYNSFFAEKFHQEYYFNLKVALVSYEDDDNNLRTRLSGIVREFESVNEDD